MARAHKDQSFFNGGVFTTCSRLPLLLTRFDGSEEMTFCTASLADFIVVSSSSGRTPGVAMTVFIRS